MEEDESVISLGRVLVCVPSLSLSISLSLSKYERASERASVRVARLAERECILRIRWSGRVPEDLTTKIVLFLSPSIIFFRSPHRSAIFRLQWRRRSAEHGQLIRRIRGERPQVIHSVHQLAHAWQFQVDHLDDQHLQSDWHSSNMVIKKERIPISNCTLFH